MLERLMQVATRTSTPDAPLDSRLVEGVVHGEDIRRPLGPTRVHPREAVIRHLHLQARTPASIGGAKEQVANTHRMLATPPKRSATAITLDNVEGLAFGPVLPDGGRPRGPSS